MKQKELVIIGGVAFITALFSFVISSALFGTPSRNPVKVPVVHKIDPSFPIIQNDSSYTTFFNDKALNPTQLIQIGGDNNQAPFQVKQ